MSDGLDHLKQLGNTFFGMFFADPAQPDKVFVSGQVIEPTLRVMKARIGMDLISDNEAIHNFTGTNTTIQELVRIELTGGYMAFSKDRVRAIQGDLTSIWERTKSPFSDAQEPYLASPKVRQDIAFAKPGWDTIAANL